MSNGLTHRARVKEEKGEGSPRDPSTLLVSPFTLPQRVAVDP